MYIISDINGETTIERFCEKNAKNKSIRVEKINKEKR